MYKLKTRLLQGLLMSGIVLLAFSCNFTNRVANRNSADDMIPADFNPNKHVLLFAEIPKKNDPDARNKVFTRKMEKLIKKYYSGKYEIVSGKQILDTNSYSDTSIYKYAVLNFMAKLTHSTKTTVTVTSNGVKNETSVAPSATTFLSNFHFYDRSSDKNYSGSAQFLNLTESLTSLIKTLNRAKGI